MSTRTETKEVHYVVCDLYGCGSKREVFADKFSGPDLPIDWVEGWDEDTNEYIHGCSQKHLNHTIQIRKILRDS